VEDGLTQGHRRAVLDFGLEAIGKDVSSIVPAMLNPAGSVFSGRHPKVKSAGSGRFKIKTGKQRVNWNLAAA
jgi:hypothetical protein